MPFAPARVDGKPAPRRGQLLSPAAVQAAREFVYDSGYSASRRLELELARERFMGDSGTGTAALLEYFPNLYAARHSFAELVAYCRETFSSDKEDDGVPPLLAPLSEDELHRRRFAHNWNAWGVFENLGPRWGRGLSLYVYLLPKSVGLWLRRLLAHLGLFQSRSSSGVAKGLKKLSDVMKKHGILLSSNWRYAVNLETLGGYRPPQPMSTFVPELKEWATGDIFHGYPVAGGLSEAVFLEHFRSGVRSFLVKSPSVVQANRHALTLDEFCSDPANWANNGSTHYKGKVFVWSEGRSVPLGRNKTTTSFLLSPQEVKRRILSPHSQTLRPIEKLETGKVRAVVNADDVVYLKMAYVSNWLERALAHHPNSTLYMSLEQRNQMWQNLSSATRFNTAKIPLDQSHFDWQPNKRMLAAVLDEIYQFISDYATVDRESLLAVTSSIKDTLVSRPGVIEVRAPGLSTDIPVEKGVMSGWRWTALIDTLCNAGELMSAQDLAAEWGFPDAVLTYTAQGDDDQVSCPSFAHATALAEAYSVMNFEINPGKFFIDTRRDEFLRLVPLPDRVVGYPSRAINNILWRNPINPDPLPGELSIRAQLSQWCLLINRGMDEARCVNLMLEDMSHRNKIERQDLVNYLLTPAPYGGCGLVGTSLQRTGYLAVIQEKIARTFTVQSSLPGVSVVQKEAQLLGLPQEVVDSAVKQRLPLDQLKGRVVDAVFRPVHDVGIATPPGPSRRWAPRSYASARSVPSLIASEAVRYWVRNHDYQSLEKHCDPDVLPWFNRFRRTMSRACFDQWLLGRLDIQAPTVLGYGPEQVSGVWAGFVNSILVCASTHRKLTQNYFRAVASAAASRVLHELSCQVPVSN